MTKPGGSPAAPPRPAVELAPGVAVGGVIADKYRVDGVIGKGGMGVVVAATQLALERTVAIKVIRSEWAEDTQAMARLLREARAAASIKSEHVARVLDVGTLPSGAPFIVMEHLEGVDLDTLLLREGPRPVPEAVDFVLQACEAIAEAHRNGIVHRDLKPANLFVARLPGGASKLKVVDFGISKTIGAPALESLTDPSRVVGSLYHMAPEQMRGMPVDARTDVWALGVVLFELLTGRKPFREGAWPAVCAQVLNETAPALGVIGASVPEELDAIVQRCLQRAPHDRYPNVAELAVALSTFGTPGARSSLEQIVRLAASTGSLSAETIPPPAPDSAREISSIEPVAAPSPSEASRVEPTVVAASPQHLARQPLAQRQPSPPGPPRPVPDLRRERRWRLAVTAGIAALALAFWLGPDAERPAPAETRTSVSQLAPNVAPEQHVAPVPPPSAVAPEPPAASSAATAADTVTTLPASDPAMAAPPPPSVTQVTPPPAAAASSAAPAAVTARAPVPANSVAPSASAAASAAATSRPASDDEAPALLEPAATAQPKAPSGSAWDLSDIEFKELPE